MQSRHLWSENERILNGDYPSAGSLSSTTDVIDAVTFHICHLSNILIPPTSPPGYPPSHISSFSISGSLFSPCPAVYRCARGPKPSRRLRSGPRLSAHLSLIPTMGRRKIEIQPITVRRPRRRAHHCTHLSLQHERNRSVTFLKVCEPCWARYK